MSMGGGGGQMPMASNRGQQQQQQQMMGQPQGMMPPQGMPQGMMSGLQGIMSGMQPPMGVKTAVGYDPNMPPSGEMFGVAPNDQMQQMAQMMQQAQQQQQMGQPQPPTGGGLQSLMPSTNMVDMKPTTMANPRAGMPTGYRPTNGPIDGRQLRDMMNINRRRPMGRGDDRNGGLPGAIENDLPPSLKRPTQGDYKRFK